jgi:hypothetical protein
MMVLMNILPIHHSLMTRGVMIVVGDVMEVYVVVVIVVDMHCCYYCSVLFVLI